MSARHTRKKCFSLIELLVVIAVIAILAGLLLPALSSSKTRAQTIKCQNNLSQISKLISGYTVSNNGVYPYACDSPAWGDPTGWMNLITEDPASKNCYKCPIERTGTEFSYALNCREIYMKTGTFGSWRDADFSKSLTGPSKIIIVEESNYSNFSLHSPDKDNYTQNCISFTADSSHYIPNHVNIIPMLFVDGRGDAVKRFDTSTMTYFTDVMSAYYE